MGTTDMTSFGQLLRRYRKAAHLTQEAVAARAEISVHSLSDAERNAGRSTLLKTTLTAIVDALELTGVDALELTGEDRSRVEAAWQRRKQEKVFLPPAVRPSPAPPLVGREREFELLERHLTGDGPPVLMFAGEPGIGKSRLLREAAARGDAGGWRVLPSGCQRRDGELAYAPLLDALKRHVEALPPPDLRAAVKGCAGLVRLLPELTAHPVVGASLVKALPSWPLTPAQERRLMFEAVARFLSNVAGPAGTLLVLDDLQWAGQDALDLLLFLLRSPSPAPEPGGSPSP